MTLALYTGPGDIILTNGSTVRKAVTAVNPGGDIEALSILELYVDAPRALPTPKK
jgi:hypothetical protein